MKANILNAERGGRAALFRTVEHTCESLMNDVLQHQRRSARRDEGRQSEMLGETKESELKKAERERCNGVIRLLIAPREMCFGLTPGQLSVAPRLLNTRAHTQHKDTHSNTLHTPFEQTDI